MTGERTTTTDEGQSEQEEAVVAAAGEQSRDLELAQRINDGINSLITFKLEKAGLPVEKLPFEFRVGIKVPEGQTSIKVESWLSRRFVVVEHVGVDLSPQSQRKVTFKIEIDEKGKNVKSSLKDAKSYGYGEDAEEARAVVRNLPTTLETMSEGTASITYTA